MKNRVKWLAGLVTLALGLFGFLAVDVAQSPNVAPAEAHSHRPTAVHYDRTWVWGSGFWYDWDYHPSSYRTRCHWDRYSVQRSFGLPLDLHWHEIYHCSS